MMCPGAVKPPPPRPRPPLVLTVTGSIGGKR